MMDQEVATVNQATAGCRVFGCLMHKHIEGGTEHSKAACSFLSFPLRNQGLPARQVSTVQLKHFCSDNAKN
jgi:hypothetical protein